MAARLPLSAIYLKPVLKIPKTSVSSRKITQGGAAGGNRLLQNFNDFRVQSGASDACHTGRLTPGRDARPKKGLADINIAKPRHHALIEKRRLYGRGALLQLHIKAIQIEPIAKRLRAHGDKMLTVFKRFGWCQIHKSKSARIIIDD